jgi:hypothetical protein
VSSLIESCGHILALRKYPTKCSFPFGIWQHLAESPAPGLISKRKPTAFAPNDSILDNVCMTGIDLVKSATTAMCKISSTGEGQTGEGQTES